MGEQVELFGDCRERWEMRRSYAYELISAADVAENVRHAGQIGPPSNPRQAAELSKLPAEDQPKAWQKAVATAPEGKVTEKMSAIADVVLVVEDRGQLVTLRVEGAPAPKYGPSKGRKPRVR